MYFHENVETLLHFDKGSSERLSGIMLIVEDLKPVAVWLDPNHMVATAKMIAEGHGLRAVGVVENGRLIGVVRTETLYGQPDSGPVGPLATTPRLIVDASMTIREVAALFVEHDVDHAPVLDGDRFIGIISANSLLRELGRSWDPLTGLSWSDRLREWGIAQLKLGNELTIIFMDLDGFGMYNKRFSHIVGDRVLKHFADFLQERIDPESDVLVRYGGDEFAIGTIRSRESAIAFAGNLKQRILQRDAGDEERISFSFGVQGGKRTKERENVHFAATLDDLISLASKDCNSQKELSKARRAMAEPALQTTPEPSAPSMPRKIEVVQVQVDDLGAKGVTQVVLNVDDKVVGGVQAREGRSVGDSVALATAKAMEAAIGPIGLSVQSTQTLDNSSGQKLVTVSVVRDGDRGMPLAGVALVADDLNFSIAEATIQAFQSGGL